MSNIKDTTDAVEGIVKAVPIYQDLLQPAVIELGKGIHTLSKTIHIALSPISALVWGYDQIKDFIQESLEKKLKDIPTEDIISPAPEIAVPVIETLRYTGHREELREMFSNLLANSMNINSEKIAHPSFVDIIKQLSPDEAKIIKLFNDGLAKPILKIRAYEKDIEHFIELLKEFSILPYVSNSNHPDLGPSYLNNLTRLGLVSFNYSTYTIANNSYDPLLNHPIVIEIKEYIERIGKRSEVYKGSIELTSFGKVFLNACVTQQKNT